MYITITITKNATKIIPKTVIITNKVENPRIYDSGTHYAKRDGDINLLNVMATEYNRWSTPEREFCGDNSSFFNFFKNFQ